MLEFFMTLWETIQNFFVAFFHSKIFFGIKVFFAIYTAVIIVDIALLVYLGDVRKQLRNMRMGATNVKTTKKEERKRWEEIMKRLESDDEKQYKASILEADHFTYEMLELQGYGGSTFAERLSQIPAGSFSSQNIIMDAHMLSTKIIRDEKAVITKEQAQNTLKVYEKFLKDIDIL
jgi:hypothetical protein